ncbi:MAG: hypothetical protein OJF52_002224 [Nitrospira sp.]|nr:MAG: hypothetical protein OJF52_002224 [Nitrospira sp.]
MRFRRSMSGEMDKGPSKHRPDTRQAEHVHRNGHDPSRRAAPVSMQRGGCSPHLSWAHAITGKFSLNANLRGLSRPSLIDLAIPARLTIRSEYFGWSSQHIHVGAILSLLCKRHFLQLRSDRIQMIQNNADRAARAGGKSNASRFGRFWEASPLTPLRLELSNLTGARSGGSATESRAGYAQRFGCTFNRPARSSSGSLGLRVEYVDDHGPSDLVVRLTSRHRRKDMTRTDLARAFGSGPSVLSGRWSLAVEGAGAQPVGTGKPHDLSAEPAGRSVPSAPAMNVSLVADEVMKQLDRRLTAARERMGRI